MTSRWYDQMHAWYENWSEFEMSCQGLLSMCRKCFALVPPSYEDEHLTWHRGHDDAGE